MKPAAPKPGGPGSKPGPPGSKPGPPGSKPGPPGSKPGPPGSKPGPPGSKPGPPPKGPQKTNVKTPETSKTQLALDEEEKPPVIVKPVSGVGHSKRLIGKFARKFVPEKPQPEPVDTGPATLSSKNVTVILALWSFGIAYTFAEGWKKSFLRTNNEVFSVDRRYNFVPYNMTRIVLLLLALMAITVIAVLTDRRKKFVIFMTGLAVYSATPFFALLTTNFDIPGFIDIMQLLQIGWIAVNPLRYWLIFYVKFPLPATQTRLVVIGCEMAIGAMEYLMAIFVTWQTFSTLVYNMIWLVLLLVMLFWVGVVCWVKRYLLTTTGPLDKIQTRYQLTKMEPSFLARHTTQHYIIFVFLIIPSVMIAVQKSTVTYFFETFWDHFSTSAHYRLDLILCLIILPVVSILLIFLPIVRLEVADLVVIGVAHLLNVIATAGILLILIMNAEYAEPDYGPLKTTAAPKGKREVELVPDFLWLPPAQAISMFFLDADKTAVIDGKQIEEVFFIQSAPSGTSLEIIVKDVNGSLEFEKKLTLDGRKSFYYKNKRLIEIEGFFDQYGLERETENVTMTVISGLEKCEYGSREDAQGTRFKYRGGCHSIKLAVKFVGPGGDLGHRVANVPLLGEVQDTSTIMVPEGTDSFSFNLLVDGEPHQNGTVKNIGNESNSIANIVDVFIDKRTRPETVALARVTVANDFFVEGKTKARAAQTDAKRSMRAIASRSIGEGNDDEYPLLHPPDDDNMKADKPKDDPKNPDKPKDDPKKPDKPKDEPKKPNKPKDEPKKPDEPKDKPKKPDKPKDEPKTPGKPKDEPKKPNKPKDEPKKPDEPKDEPKKPGNDSIPKPKPGYIYTTEFPLTTPPSETFWFARGHAGIAAYLNIASIASGIAAVSYIHFVWIQCPWGSRTVILALFFGANYIGLWFPPNTLVGFDVKQFVCLLICHSVGYAWHVCLSIFYGMTLAELTDKEKNEGAKRKF